MQNRRDIAVQALTSALRLRKQLNVGHEESISALDAADKLGIETRFVDLPSMEGMYIAGPNPAILLSSLRPQGRRAFTCAHEIGHHILGHGAQFDELVSDKGQSRRDDPREFAADCFASYFLIPKVTLENGLSKRGLSYSSLEPSQVYRLSSWLGVGYRTLIGHMAFGLKTISTDQAERLKKAEPRDIRQALLSGMKVPSLHVADEHWVGRAIDCEVGGYVMAPRTSHIEGSSIRMVEALPKVRLFEAAKPGIARIHDQTTGWSAFIRVSRKAYTGRSCFRFEEECD
jgi:Zn-dependent peptidase ImmA (M78 family)